MVLLFFLVPNEPYPKVASQVEASSSSKSYLDHISSSDELSSSSAAAAIGPSSYPSGSAASVATGGLPSAGDSAGSTGGDPGNESTSSVQFMWQPLSDINYPSITLLASFKVSLFS